MARFAKPPQFECRHCGCRVSKVTKTMTHEITYYGKRKTFIKRRRVCNHCKLPYTTIECIEDENNPGNPELNTDTPVPGVGTSPKEKPKRAKRGRNPYL